jgi:hypothetical protein
MEVEAMKEGEINDEAGEEVVMKDMNYAKLKNKFVKLSSEEELMAQFSTVRSCKNRRNR